MRSLEDIREEFEFLEGDDRYRLLIDLGKDLEPMPDALKNDQTLVQGCSAAVWAYPTRPDGERLHFLADSSSTLVKGVIALVLTAVQDLQPADVLAIDIEGALEPFNVQKYLSSNRTQGIPNMIALIRETAARYAAA